MRIPIVSGLIDRAQGKQPEQMNNIETPEILPPPDFSQVNAPGFSEAHYRSLEKMAQVESKPDLLGAIERSDLSRQAKDAWIMFVQTELDTNMMYSDLSEDNNFQIAHYMMLINMMVTTVGSAYKSDRKKEIFSALTTNLTNQTWRRDTRNVGKDRERTLAAMVGFKYVAEQRKEKQKQ